MKEKAFAETILELFLAILLFIVALVLIIKGGDFLVDSAIWLAKITKIPELIIGATVVSLATTLPEIMVSVLAAARGPEAYGMAVGNAAGSMICNIALIAALAFLFNPGKNKDGSFLEKCFILTGITVLFMIFSYTGGSVNWWEGILLLVAFVLFIGYNVWDALRAKKSFMPEISIDDVSNLSATPEPELVSKSRKDWIKNIAFFIIGAAGIAGGAQLLVDNGLKISGFMGISDALMGLTFVAVGTSLPELVTMITSIRKKKGSLGMGNIIGANIINCSLLIGLCAVIAGANGGTLSMDAMTRFLTLPVMLLVTLLVMLPTLLLKRNMRWQGVALLCIYISYIVMSCLIEVGIIAI